MRGSRSGWSPLAGLLAVAGTAHLVLPGPFDALVPRALGRARPWVLGSGVAELACAAGLASARTRRGAALATAVLFAAVFPGNVTMARTSFAPPVAPPARRVAALVRLPLQVPLVLWALRTARTARAAGGLGSAA